MAADTLAKGSTLFTRVCGNRATNEASSSPEKSTQGNRVAKRIFDGEKYAHTLEGKLANENRLSRVPGMWPYPSAIGIEVNTLPNFQ